MKLYSRRRPNALPGFSIAWLLSLLIFTPLGLMAQDPLTIKGVILDGRTNSPLPDVSVLVKGAGTGAKTGANGEYSIRAKKGDMLVFSFSGYETQEVKV